MTKNEEKVKLFVQTTMSMTALVTEGPKNEQTSGVPQAIRFKRDSSAVELDSHASSHGLRRQTLKSQSSKAVAS